MNTFKVMLYRRANKFGFRVAQRLKRRNTIFDKLKREPNMQLTTMHDIAGFRLIFDDEEILNRCRADMHASRAKHIRRSEDDQYNYIRTPKDSGYRGIHDVYEYVGSKPLGRKFDGLLVELQYRTIYQHAWATAVEVADLITTNRIKFSDTTEEYREFFRVTSELIARRFESRVSVLSDSSNAALKKRFTKIEKKLGLLNALDRLRQSDEAPQIKDHTLLVFHYGESDEQEDLEIHSFQSISLALKKYEELEKKLAGKADIVLVRADSPETVRIAFRNYFTDAEDFVRYVRAAQQQSLPRKKNLIVD